MTNVNSCTASFTQIAGIEALRGNQTSVEHMCSEFKRRRDRVVERINQVPGFHCRVPKGAFYVFRSIRETSWTSKNLADALIHEAGVACLAGADFGAYCEGYLPFSIS